MSASFNLGPPNESPLSLFIKSQMCADVRWPPKSTNLEGKVAVVTGSSSGLGLEASRQLLSFGLSTLIIAVRSAEKGEQVVSELRTQFSKATIQVWPLEMESYESIQAFVRDLDSQLPRLDIAILNAGMQTADFSVVRGTGHEKLVQVNYLSTMLLGILLLPVLKTKSPPKQPGRLTIVSSGTARGAKISGLEGAPVLSTLDDSSRPWAPVERYAVSKLLSHLFIVSLVRYISADDVVVNLVDPGLVKDTGLQRFAPPLIAAFFYCYKAVLGRAVPVGASTYVDAAVIKGKESHGCYVANWKVSPFAAFVYTLEGEAVREKLWNETMAEFDFAKVREILDGLKG
ncbi:hypothetical protein F4781DRAFT_428062 [Annulohypoxylon bovei var. microspora]|nr:hypothetical protein F4781DRAFT_428062 [Annulohypoxylon bovei var. microspora]